MVEVEWNELVFSSADNLLQQLEKIAHKRFPDDQQLADQAFNEALATLSANNWQILKAYQGKSSPKGYLIVTFRNTIEDYARKRFGRLRPPEDVKRKGAVWLEIYNRLVLEKQLEPTIIDAIIAQTALSAADVQDIIRTIKQLTTPKTRNGFTHQDDTALENLPDAPSNDPYHAAFGRPLLERIGSFLTGVLSTDRSLPNQLDELINEDYVLLQLIYSEGLKISQCARMLNLPDQKVRRRHERILQLLRQHFKEQGWNNQ